jgi:hypothetical protein
MNWFKPEWLSILKNTTLSLSYFKNFTEHKKTPEFAIKSDTTQCQPPALLSPQPT